MSASDDTWGIEINERFRVRQLRVAVVVFIIRPISIDLEYEVSIASSEKATEQYT